MPDRNVAKTCQTCGKHFTIPRCYELRGRGKHCSHACRSPKAQKTCLTCNNPFTINATSKQHQARKYCSQACHYAYHHREPTDNGNGTYTVPLTQGFVAIIDKEDAPTIAQHTWTTLKPNKGNTPYAQARINGKMTGMHKFLMNPPKGMVTDHWDHDGLNNRRSNLRIVTHAQNLQNVRYVHPRFINKRNNQ